MSSSPYVSTTNACKLCAPLGAALAFKGFEGCVPFLHGSQGCATYMRRYIISHFREPMDIASSALGEKQAVFGGAANLKQGILNVMKKYNAALVGVATTCLTETLGENVPGFLEEFRREFRDLPLPTIVHAATPSYAGTHADGWHAALRALVDQVVTTRVRDKAAINLLPGLVSCEDVRYLKEILRDFELSAVLLPDISETLDGTPHDEYEPIPAGGTPLSAVRQASGARLTIEFGRTVEARLSAGALLKEKFGVSHQVMGLPIGLRETDEFFRSLEKISEKMVPRRHVLERGRLLDALVDGHKYLNGKRAVVYGEEDLVVGLVSFLAEIGVRPVLIATGAKGKGLARALENVSQGLLAEPPSVMVEADFFDIGQAAEKLEPDLLIGHSKGYHLARSWNIPLVRVGFPIHDRFGGQRLLHVGYRGAQSLLDRIINALLAKQQNDHSVGYGYL